MNMLQGVVPAGMLNNAVGFVGDIFGRARDLVADRLEDLRDVVGIPRRGLLHMAHPGDKWTLQYDMYSGADVLDDMLQDGCNHFSVSFHQLKPMFELVDENVEKQITINAIWPLPDQNNQVENAYGGVCRMDGFAYSVELTVSAFRDGSLQFLKLVRMDMGEAEEKGAPEADYDEFVIQDETSTRPLEHRLYAAIVRGVHYDGNDAEVAFGAAGAGAAW